MAQKKQMSFRFDDRMFREMDRAMLMLGLDPDSITKTSAIETVVDMFVQSVMYGSNKELSDMRHDLHCLCGVDRIQGTPYPFVDKVTWTKEDGIRCVEERAAE